MKFFHFQLSLRKRTDSSDAESSISNGALDDSEGTSSVNIETALETNSSEEIVLTEETQDLNPQSDEQGNDTASGHGKKWQHLSVFTLFDKLIVK